MDEQSRAADAAQRVVEIGEQLGAQVKTLSAGLTEELLDRITDLRSDAVTEELLLVSVVGNLENVAYLLRGQVDLDNLPVPPPAFEYSRRLAQRGVSLSSLLRAYRLGQRRILDWTYSELARIEDDPGIAFLAGRSLAQTTFDYVDRISMGVVDAYQTEREQWLSNRNALRSDALDALLAGGARTADNRAADTEAALGYRLHHVHLGVLIWRTGTVRSAGDLGELERLARELGVACGVQATPLVVSRDSATVWAWLPLGAGTEEVDQAAIDAAVSTGGDDLRVATGTPAAGADGFRVTHLEALKAQQVAMAGHATAARVTSYADPGVRAASLLTTDLDGTRRMVARSLGGLAADTEAAERLRETLLTFLRSGDSYVATADVVHLHKNTVKYRVDKAIEARGLPLHEDRFGMELALIACQQLGAEVLVPEG